MGLGKTMSMLLRRRLAACFTSFAVGLFATLCSIGESDPCMAKLHTVSSWSETDYMASGLLFSYTIENPATAKAWFSNYTDMTHPAGDARQLHMPKIETMMMKNKFKDRGMPHCRRSIGDV